MLVSTSNLEMCFGLTTKISFIVGILGLWLLVKRLSSYVDGEFFGRD